MSERVAELAASLQKTMGGASEWEKKRTSVPGVFLVRLPGPKLRVMLEFNPPGADGAPTKRKGLYFGDARTLEAARKAFPDPRMDDLVAAVEALAEKAEAGAKAKGNEDVFEV